MLYLIYILKVEFNSETSNLKSKDGLTENFYNSTTQKTISAALMQRDSIPASLFLGLRTLALAGWNPSFAI